MIEQYILKYRERSGFDKLERRERLMILFGLFFLVGFFILQFGVGPYLEAGRKLDASIANREADITELQVLQQEYRDLQAEAGGIKEQLTKRAPDFSLFSFLDKQAAAAGVKEFIGYMKPSTSEGDGDLLESLVEMKLQQITLEKLVGFLQLIESPENVVSIKRISIQESGKEKGLLEVIIQIVTFVNNG
jgi:hypothetical protein